jgi:hypothetical protein
MWRCSVLLPNAFMRRVRGHIRSISDVAYWAVLSVPPDQSFVNRKVKGLNITLFEAVSNRSLLGLYQALLSKNDSMTSDVGLGVSPGICSLLDTGDFFTDHSGADHSGRAVAGHTGFW